MTTRIETKVRNALGRDIGTVVRLIESMDNGTERQLAAEALGRQLASAPPGSVDSVGLFAATDDEALLTAVLEALILHRNADNELGRMLGDLTEFEIDDEAKLICRRVREWLVTSAAVRNPQEAWSHLSEAGGGDDGFLDVVLREVLRTNPLLALNLEGHGDPGSVGSDRLRTMAGMFDPLDWDARAKFLNAALSFDSGRAVEADLVKSLLLDDNHLCLRGYVERFSLAALSPSSAAAVADRLADDDPDALAAWIEKAPQDQLVEVLSRGETFGTQLNGDVAEAVWKRGLDFEQIQPERLIALARSISDGKSVAEVETLLLGDDSITAELRGSLVRGIVQSLARTDPQGAIELLHESFNDRTPESDKAVSDLASQWARYDMEAAIAAFTGLEPSWGAAFLTGLAENAGQNPKAAAGVLGEWLGEASLSGADTEAAEKMAGQIGEKLWAADLSFVGEWLSDLPTGSIQNSAANNLMDSLKARSPVKISEMLSTWPEGSLRDSMVGKLARALPEDPNGALAWAASISDSSVRRAAIGDIIDEWGVFPDGVPLDLEANGLNEQDREWIRAQISK